MNGKTGHKFSVIKLFFRMNISLDNRLSKMMAKNSKIRFYGLNLDLGKFTKTTSSMIKQLKLIKIF